MPWCAMRRYMGRAEKVTHPVLRQPFLEKKKQASVIIIDTEH